MDSDFESVKARTHLANERTYLAWMRNALAALGIGLLATRIFEEEGQPLKHKAGLIFGILLIASSIVVAIWSSIVYIRTKEQIDSNSYVPSSALIYMSTLSFLVIAVLAIAFIVWDIMF